MKANGFQMLCGYDMTWFSENSGCCFGHLFSSVIKCSTVDGRNPANQLRLVVYPTTYKVLYIPGGAGFLNHQQYGPARRRECGNYPFLGCFHPLHFLYCTLPQTNIAPRPSQKETSIPTTIFQVRTVSLRGRM